MNTDATFWSRIEACSDHWLWTGRMNQFGYGVFNINGDEILAHRYALGLPKSLSYNVKGGPVW